MAEKSFFDRLNNIFTTAILVRTKNSNKIRNIDIDRLQSMSNLETRRLAQKIPGVRKSASDIEYVNVAGFNINRLELYNEYDVMDKDPIVSSAIDIYSEEAISKNDVGDILTITSENEKIKENLENLFFDILDIEFNLFPWIRNLVKYGDFYLKLELVEKIGVTSVIPLSPFAMTRIDNGIDQDIKYRYDDTVGLNVFGSTGYSAVNSRNKVFNNFEIAHFRLLSDTNFFPYGRSILENARSAWKQVKLMEEAMFLQRIMRAPERRIFKVDVGNIGVDDIDNYLLQTIARFKKTPFIDPATGEYDLKFNLKPIASYSLIPLLDGRIITIKELATETKRGRVNWVYSINEKKEITPGRIIWCDVTKKDSKLIRIVIQDNSYLDLEPSHPIMLTDGTFKEAKDIKVNDNFMPFRTKTTNMYEEIYDPSTKKYKNILSISESEIPELEEIITCTSVDILQHTDDVYCMEIDSNHNFAVITNDNTGFFVKNSSLEDYYFPVRGNQTGTEIDTLPGMEWNGIEDLSYLFGKLLAGLKVPKSFLNYDEELSAKAHLASEDVRFSRTIERIQRMVINELTKIAIIHLYTQGFSDENLTEFELELTTSSKLAELERLELLDQKVDTASSMIDINMFSTKWIYENIFNFSETEIEEIQKEIVNDKQMMFRFEQIEQEGNDPSKTFEKVSGIEDNDDDNQVEESKIQRKQIKTKTKYTSLIDKLNKSHKTKKIL